jgi:uncharacterized protein YjdB
VFVRARSVLGVFVAIAAVMMLTGCCGKFFKGEEDLVGVSVSPSGNTIQPGGTQQFTATGTFAESGATGDVSGQTRWTSSDPSVATIDATGLATGVAFGTVTIKGKCQCFDDKVTLTVGSQTVSLTSITVTPASPTVTVGRNQQFTATGNFSNNTTDNITSSVVWSSSDGSVATINSAGLATAVAPGNATIRADSGTITGSTTITVQQ